MRLGKYSSLAPLIPKDRAEVEKRDLTKEEQARLERLNIPSNKIFTDAISQIEKRGGDK